MSTDHWQSGVSGFYCELDPKKTHQSPSYECSFCRQAERDELKELKLKAIKQEAYIDHLENKLAGLMIQAGVTSINDLGKGEPF